MVKQSLKILTGLFLLTAFFTVSCTNDYFGIIASNDLGERLVYKDKFFYLNKENRNWKNNLDVGDDESFSFIVVTDSHLEEGKKGTFDNYDKFGEAVRNTPNVKFVVHLGDATQSGYEKEINKFLEVSDSLGVPFYPAIGNHDFYFYNWHYWRDKIGSTSYRVDDNKNKLSLYILDSGNSYFGKEQLDWLEKDIISANELVFVFTHAPLFVEGPVDMQQLTDTKERARMASILRNRCNIMFMGHLHKNMYNKTGNVIYLGLASFIEDQAYCLVTVTGSKVEYKMMYLK